MNNEAISATLVYDGGDSINVPDRLLPTPPVRPDTEWASCDLKHYADEKVKEARQLAGSVHEQLCELAGRTCYDSLGAGRPSLSFTEDNGKMREGYHDHILKVRHSSVYAHANATFWVTGKILSSDALHWPLHVALRDIPGVFVRPPSEVGGIVATINLRSCIDILCYAHPWIHGHNKEARELVTYILRQVVQLIAPNLNTPEVPYCNVQVASIEPQLEEEQWATLLLTGSRGFSHEMVRHNYRCAISQRSTRYVDESKSPWVAHPLVRQYLDEGGRGLGDDDRPDLGEWIQGVASSHYNRVVASMEPWLISRGVDKFTARKQARGAARGYLGNALYTEVMFSASVAQWKRILRQRATIHADAEIREVAVQALRQLQGSRYADRFANWSIEPSPDGIGQVAVEAM